MASRKEDGEKMR